MFFSDSRDGQTSGRVSQSLADFPDDFVFVRKLSGFQLGIDEFTVDRQLKTSATRGLQFEPLQLLLVLRQDFGRQTDGLGFVVSCRAVTKMNLHGWSLGVNGTMNGKPGNGSQPTQLTSAIGRHTLESL